VPMSGSSHGAVRAPRQPRTVLRAALSMVVVAASVPVMSPLALALVRARDASAVRNGVVTACVRVPSTSPQLAWCRPARPSVARPAWRLAGVMATLLSRFGGLPAERMRGRRQPRGRDWSRPDRSESRAQPDAVSLKD
jgi:hypothetical protein